MIIPGIRINTIEIPVEKLDRATEWYRDVLGIACVWSDISHALLDGMISTSEAFAIGIRVLLVETRDVSRLVFSNSKTKVIHSVIDFQTEDIDIFHKYLKSKNVNVDVLGLPGNDWAPRGFGFFDSEGNRLGAYSYSSNQEN
ncbi:MAG: hypothetical protein UY48_C0034G0010 [Candidatus Gottesmanbacteria bacterium GW2011_GWB1_49_7]|uniref:VOC domain-containing protein n=1 Tax=Candidatus Gottesmanbacteria bacterium GW2011_GWB1_49_7 TaxID=1618448 RepID=A0A0G1VW84_9BACT|nr:MAG: hypothetical protein UY48_C0034G0010 [Candidatus Gottesmanbacteria bacterium GW2011_GWB1_49_7]